MAPLAARGLGHDRNREAVAGLLVQDDEVRLVGIAEGQATVRVAVGSLSQEVAVTVGAEVTP
jgi:hypothetical protein